MKINLQYKFSKITYFFPLILFFLFSLFTILSFTIGPYLYGEQEDNFTILYLYLFFVHLSIFIGYFKGLSSSLYIDRGNFNYKKVLRILKYPIIVFTFFIIYTYRNKFNTSNLSENRDFFNYEFLGTWQSHFSLILFIFLYPFFGIVIYFWDKFNFIIKYFSFLVFLVYGPVGGIISGSRSNVYASIVLFSILFYFLIKSNKIKINKYLFYSFIFFILISFISFSTSVTNSRMNASGFDGNFSEYTEKLEILNDVNASLKQEHLFLSERIPSFLSPALLQGSFYFGHCYYGLYKCLISEGKYIGFPFSHSAVLNRSIGAYISEKFYQTSYIEFLVRKGEYSYSLWITSYAWIANDIGFFLSIFFFGFLSYLLSSTWKNSLSGRNVYAFIVFIWTFIAFMSIHVSFIDGDYGSLISYYCSIYFYLKMSKKSN